MQRVILKDPLVLQIDEVGESLEQIHQEGYFVTEERKGVLLRYLIKHEQLQQVLVFVSSRKKADNVVAKLCKNKINASAPSILRWGRMHGAMPCSNSRMGACRCWWRQTYCREGSISIACRT